METHQFMKKFYQWFFYLVILGVLVWGFVTPTGIRGAWANNVWSTNFVKAYFEGSSLNSQLPSPPATHSHSGLYLLKLAFKQNDYDKALAYMTPMIEAKDPIAMEAYAELQYLQENYNEAFNIWRELGDTASLLEAYNTVFKMGRMDLVLLAYRNLYEIQPEIHTAQYAYWLFDQKQFEESNRTLQQSIIDFPESTERINWLRLLGNNYLAEKKWSEAEDLFFQILSEDQENWQAWRSLGWLYHDRDDDINRAIECFTKAIEIDPMNPVIYSWIAKDFLNLRKYDLAISTIEKAGILMEEPTIGYYLEAGQIYEWSGHKEEAKIAYQKALNLEPNNLVAKQGIQRLSGSD